MKYNKTLSSDTYIWYLLKASVIFNFYGVKQSLL